MNEPCTADNSAVLQQDERRGVTSTGYQHCATNLLPLASTLLLTVMLLLLLPAGVASSAVLQAPGNNLQPTAAAGAVG